MEMSLVITIFGMQFLITATIIITYEVSEHSNFIMAAVWRVTKYHFLSAFWQNLLIKITS